MTIYLKLCLFFLLILTVSACSKDDNETTAIVITGSAYFPVDSGLTRFYQVDSVYWDEFTGLRDTVSYELKEILAGDFIDNQGRVNQRIERFRKDNSGNWIISKVWYALRTNRTAENVEDNIRFIKLTFPTTSGNNWNGNAYNTLLEKNYEYTSVGGPDSSFSLNFSNTLTVNQDDEPANLLNDRNDLEKFALNIGMYYRLNSYLEFNFLSGDTISGFIYTERLINYYP